MPPLRRPRLCLLGTLALLACSAGCDCGPTGVEQLRFACSEAAPCGAGFSCVLGECMAADAGAPPDAGEGDGGARDGGLRVAFLTPPLTLRVGQCSGAVSLGLLDGAGAPVPGPRTLQVSTTAPGGRFFANDTCAAPEVGTLEVPAGLTAGPLYVRGALAGSFVLNAASEGAAPAQQELTVLPALATALSFADGGTRARAGECLSARLELRDFSGALVAQPSPVSVDLLAAPLPLETFAGPGCAGMQVAAVTVPGGQSSAALSVRSRSGGSATLTASAAGLMPATLPVTVLPVVRTSTCSFAVGAGQAVCPLSPPQEALGATQTYVFPTGPAGPTAGAGAVQVNCSFAADGGQLACRRRNTTVAVQLQVATVELQGSTVQQVGNLCDDAGTYNLPLPMAVDPTATYLLTQGISGGVLFDEYDTFSASLPNGSTLRVTYPTVCPAGDPGASFQVVTLPAATVGRGLTSMAQGEAQVSVSAAAGAGVVQHTARVLGVTADPVCDRLIRSEPVAGAVAFTRGLLDAGSCATQAAPGIAWERIDYGTHASKVLNRPFSMAAGAATATLSLAGEGFVDRTRTLVFMGQGVAGQGMGELEACAFSDLGAALARYTLNGPADGGLAVESITFRRGNTNVAARWTAHVVQFEP